MLTLDDLIADTLHGRVVWTRDGDPQASWHGRTVFVAAQQTYMRVTKGDWMTLGPADDLRRAIEHRQRTATS